MMTRFLSAVLMLSLGACAATAIETTNANTISDIYGLESLFVEQQYLFLPIGPPSEDVLVQPYGPVVPVDWKKFPEDLTKLMYAEMDANGYPLYRISIYEDPITRETVFLNSYAMEVYRLEAEAGYDPYAWVKTTFQIDNVSELDEFLRWIYDPAHVASEFILIPETFYADYESSQQELAAQALLSEPMSMMMSLPAMVTNLQMAINSTTNGAVEIEVGWPTGFSDMLEIYATTNLVAADWQFAYTNITTSGETNFLWVDTETNLNQRFYITGNADLDEDGDGLASARERYLYKTRSDLFDTDGDGLGDGWEMDYGFLPLSIIGTNGALGDADNDGYSNLEEQLNGTDPLSLNSNSNTGTVATIRYYYDEDDRLSDFYCSSEVAQKTILTVSHNISEEVSSK